MGEDCPPVRVWATIAVGCDSLLTKGQIYDHRRREQARCLHVLNNGVITISCKNCPQADHMAPPPIPPKRILPSKEATLFKELLTLYETRQLKKGQKTADQILKKFPEHGGMKFTLLNPEVN